MKQFGTILLILLLANNAFAQEYILEGKKRLNFAKTYLELGGQFSPSFKGHNAIGNFKNSSSFVPYLNIGGLHFWGHAEFYFSIPLNIGNVSKNDSISFQFNQSVVTGARVLPWAYKDKKIRPYIGTGWSIVNFKQSENQPLHSKNKLIFDVGFLFGKRNLMTRLGVNFYPSNKLNYPITPTNFQEIHTPNWSAYFGLIYSFETTRSKNMEKENSRLNSFPNVSNPTLGAFKEGDWFFGIGPSTSFMLSKSDYNETFYPYFTQKPISNTHLDISLGYQFNKAGIVAALSYRNPKFTNEAYATTQTIKKNSITLEVFKFLTDYSGFTPYLGVNIAYDNIDYSENTNLKALNTTFKNVNPGITFGWDILPGKTEQWFVLRTNLRWHPFSKFELNGKSYSQNQIEYNVIQAVFYPSRFKNNKLKKIKYDGQN